MKQLFLAVASLLFSAISAHPSKVATGPFLTQVDNTTWILGNDIWNVTQQQTYGVELMYKGRDCVGEAAGHYVSYSMCKTSSKSQFFLFPTKLILLQMAQRLT
jgi:rhamnogalacturonan endolyase